MEIRMKIETGSFLVELVGTEGDDYDTTLKNIGRAIKESLEMFSEIEMTIPEEMKGKEREISEELIGKEFNGKIDELARMAEVKVEDLRHIIHFGEDAPHLLVKVKGSTRTEEQRKGSLVLFTVLDQCYGRNVISASDMKAMLKKSVIDERKFGHAFSKVRGLLIPKGEKKGRSYEITVPGRKEGYKIIRELVEKIGSVS